MKTKILGLIVGIMFFPLVASAQTVPSSNDLLISTINQLIGLINEEIQSLQAQLIQIEANQASSTPVVISTSTPIVSTPTSPIPQLPPATVIIQEPTDVPIYPVALDPICTLTSGDYSNFEVPLNWTIQNGMYGGIGSRNGGVYDLSQTQMDACNSSAPCAETSIGRIGRDENNYPTTTTYTLTAKGAEGLTTSCSITVIPIQN